MRAPAPAQPPRRPFHDLGRRASLTLALAFWAALVAVPSAALLARLGTAGTGLRAALLAPDVVALARATAWQAAWSTVIATALGLGLGLWAWRSRSRAARLWLAVPYGVPTVVAGAAWIAWLGRSGLLSRAAIAPGWLGELAYSLGAVILAHVFFNAPWVALQVAQALDDVSPDALAAARTLGAGRAARFRYVLWPEARGALATAACQVFALCAMSFALVLLLGGGPPVETLETGLYSRVRGGQLDLGSAAACAAWEAAITLGPWFFVCILQARRRGGGHATGQRPASKPAAPGAAFAAFFFVLPYLVVLSPGVLEAWVSPAALEWLEPLRLSLAISSSTALGAVGVAALGVYGVSRSRSPWLVALLTSASGISVLVLGLGAWFAYRRWIDPFEGSLSAIILLQVAVFAPIAFRMLWPVLRGTRARLLEAASTLGAGPARAFWWVEWPRWRRPVVSALALVGAASLGEVAAVSLFYSERLVPLPLLITRRMSQYQFAEAQAIAALLFVVAAGAVFATFQLNGSLDPQGQRPH